MSPQRFLLFVPAAFFLGVATLPAETEIYSFTPNAVIPDFDSSGLADTRVLSSAITVLTDVQLTLTISGGYNGDYYAYLSHGSGFAILLNRVGRTGANAFGATDAGFTNVTFTGSALADIHTYASVTDPAGGPLVGGLWAVDGRNVDPAGALDTSPRSAFLSSFQGLPASGGWTLYVADLAPAGQGTLSSWSLTLTGVSAVPEPATWAAGALAGLAAGAVLRRRKAGKKDRIP